MKRWLWSLVLIIFTGAAFGAEAPKPYQVAGFAIFQAANTTQLLTIPAANNVQTNWQDAGLASIGGIPTRNTQCGSTVIPSGLTPPQAGDDFNLITAAEAACPSNEVVQLGPGTFSFDQTESFNLNKSITLRGDGNCTNGSSPRCNTLITVRNGTLPTYVGGGQCGTLGPPITVGTCGASNSVIYMSPTGNFDYGWKGGTTSSCGHVNPCNSGTPLAVDAAQGDTTIQVTDTTGFAANDWVMIDEASGALWQSDPVSAFGQTWASPDLTSSSASPATNRIVWAEHNPKSAIDDYDFNTGSYPYNTPDGLSCGYGINCDRATSEMHKISAIGAGPCPGAGCTLSFDSPLTIAFRVGGGVSFMGYISSGLGSSTPGSVLTVTSIVSGGNNLAVQQPLWWSGQTPGSAGTPISYITALGTGAGGTGTYTTSNAQVGGTANTAISVGTPAVPVLFSAAAHNAQVYLPAHQSGSSAVAVLQQAGVENLSISRPQLGGISMQFCVNCWVKNVEVYGWFNGGVDLYDSARSQVDTVYVHDCYDCESNGTEYAFSLNAATTENLLTNSIINFAGKSMVGRACGGGNVVAYNYADDTFYMASSGIGNYWMEFAVNGSHYKGCHHTLFEGNYGDSGGDDSTHGNVTFHTYFRNQLVGLRTPFNDPSFTNTSSSTFNLTNAPNNDQTPIGFATGQPYPYTHNGPLRAANEMIWNYWHAFSGNVLGKSGVTTAGNGWVNTTGNLSASGAMWMLGWNSIGAATDPNLDGTNSPRWIWRDGNFDYFSSSVTWNTTAHSLPNSLYLSGSPSFFGPGASATYTWPWIDSTSVTPIKTNSLGGAGLPAKARWDAGTPFVQP